jgi:tetratricopeptide (TPR) repeat protein
MGGCGADNVAAAGPGGGRFLSLVVAVGVAIGVAACGQVEKAPEAPGFGPLPTAARPETPRRADPVVATAELPPEAAAQRHEALAALEAGDATRALAALEAAARQVGWTAVLLVDKAIALGLSGDAEASLEAAEAAIALAPAGAALPEAHAVRIEALLWVGDRVAALRAADALTGAHPGRVEGHFARGKALLELARGPEAVEAFRDALARAPGDIAVTLGLAAALSFALAHGEAFALLDPLADAAPGDPWVAYQLGIASQSAGLADDALAWHRKAIELGGPAAIPDAHLQVATLLLARDDSAGARPHLELFLAHAPPSAAPERRFATQQLERTTP